MLKVFIGYDERQPVSYNVLQHSIIRNASQPVSITPLVLKQLPLKRVGLTPFTFSRFLVPYLCNYDGWALFLDIDMVAKGDIAELFAKANEEYSVMVSKNKLQFEWASAMLFNCSKCQILTPGYIEKADKLHLINWAAQSEIGDLPREWNHLVGYDKPRTDAKLIHYTQGVPCFPETETCEWAGLWNEEHGLTNSAMPWEYLMGPSVHAATLNGKRVPNFHIEPYIGAANDTTAIAV